MISTGKRQIKIVLAVLTAVMVLAQTICVYADEMEGTVCVDDFLNVREEADDDADIVEVLHDGDKVTIVGKEGDWYQVSGEHNGYVHSGYVAVASQAQEQEAAEEQAQAENSQQSQQAAVSASQAQPQQTTAGAKNEYGVSEEEIGLMAALIACECGAGGYDGKLAVGAVIMNRARLYGGVTKAIYAPSQFGPVSSGKLAATLASGAIDAISLQAARDAANGANNIGAATHFRNARSGHVGIVAGNHVFW
ncbi:MAG: cell wall hydrolase [Lachnospiraceae bacterium]|nr:cell wall hydrolase [Lachnospiraceae bacterium]